MIFIAGFRFSRSVCQDLLVLVALVLVAMVFALSANAATYNLTSGQYPPCSTTWSVSGTTYTCTSNGRVTLANGDILVAGGNITISANDGFYLNNNTIGSASATINLVSACGNIDSFGSNTIFGNLTSSSGNITLVNTTVNGTITTGGAVNLTGGRVSGLVTSISQTVITNGTNLNGGARAHTGMNFTGGTLSGNFVMTSNNPFIVSAVTMTNGSISGSSNVLIQNNSQLGSSASPITINTNAGPIIVNNSTVYGDLTAPNYSTVDLTNNGTVYGTCLPNSTPANACNPSPPECTTGLIGGLLGSYYNTTNLSGGVVGTRVDTSVNFDWGNGASGVGGVNANQFSVRWTGRLRAPSTGSYRFQTVSDDGVRLWVNNQLLIDNWTDHSATTNTSGTITLQAGYAYDVRLEYYENNGQSVIRLLWSTPNSPSFTTLSTAAATNPSTANFCEIPPPNCNHGFVGAAVGQYFNNVSLSGAPTATRQDLVVDFDWGTGAPGVAGVGSDNFSVRWDATIKPDTSGNYQFQTLSDDGVRLWVNNQLVINNWTDHPATTDTSGNINLTAGQTYPVRLEFYERTGFATISLRWRRVGGGGGGSSFVPISGCAAKVGFYGISHSGAGLTCTAEPITISAYDVNGALVAPDAGTQVLLSTSPATGSWVSASYSFTGTETSFVAFLRQTTPATLNINVTDGIFTESASLDPSISFADTGLKFYNVTGTNLPIADQRAGVAATTPVLRAVRTNTDTGACEARVTGARSVNLSYECVNPTTCVAGQTFNLQGVGIASNPQGSSTNRTPVTLTFNANGEAAIPFTYSDAGQVRLHASLPLGVQGNNPALTLTGSSNNFVVVPDRLAITQIQSSNGTNNPGATSAAGAAAGFVAAGEAFRVVVQAQNANQQPTPNFGRELSSENNILLKEFAIVHPAGGTLTPLSNGTAGSFAPVTPQGSFENTNLRWNQVGSLTLRPELADNTYLGAGQPTYIVSGTVGRFYPDRFVITSNTLNNSCTSFSYMSQPIPLTYELQARAVDGSVPSNYGASYGSMPQLTYVAENANGGNGAVLSGRVTENSAKNWAAGRLLVGTNMAFERTSAPDGPFTSLNIGMSLNDSFDNRALAGLNMNANTTGVCAGVSCTSYQLNATPLNLRFGRLRLDDAFGSGTANLPVNFATEFWLGNRFVLNQSDSCTQILRSDIRYPAGNILNPSNLAVAINGGTTTGSYANLTANHVQFAAGSAGQVFSAPGAAASGSFPVQVDLTNYPWLRFDWNADGSHNDAQLPPAQFGFGSYRGHDRIIYWRERFD